MDETDLFDYLLIGFAVAVSLKAYSNALFPEADDHASSASSDAAAGLSTNEPLQAVPLDSTASRLRRTLERIRIACRYPAIDTFIEGAKRAYEDIVAAFASGDLRAQSFLLASPVRDVFEAAIAARRAEGQTATFTLIAFDAVEIADAGFEANTAWIEVRFVTEAVSAILDRDGRVVAGHPTETARLAEVWTFEKQLGSGDANWVLVATSAADGDDMREGAAHEDTCT